MNVDKVKSLYYDRVANLAMTIRSDRKLGRKVKELVYRNMGVQTNNVRRECKRQTVYLVY